LKQFGKQSNQFDTSEAKTVFFQKQKSKRRNHIKFSRLRKREMSLSMDVTNSFQFLLIRKRKCTLFKPADFSFGDGAYIMFFAIFLVCFK
jgi:hypothetical protein